MTSHHPQVESRALRELLKKAFSVEELKAFCFDNFRDVYDDFGTETTKHKMVQELIEYCTRRGKLSELLDRIVKARPDLQDSINSLINMSSPDSHASLHSFSTAGGVMPDIDASTPDKDKDSDGPDYNRKYLFVLVFLIPVLAYVISQFQGKETSPPVVYHQLVTISELKIEMSGSSNDRDIELAFISEFKKIIQDRYGDDATIEFPLRWLSGPISVEKKGDNIVWMATIEGDVYYKEDPATQD